MHDKTLGPVERAIMSECDGIEIAYNKAVKSWKQLRGIKSNRSPNGKTLEERLIEAEEGLNGFGIKPPKR